MVKNSALVKLGAAIVVCGAAIWGATQVLEQSRHVTLAVYGLLFLAAACLVAVFRGRARDAALVCAAVLFGLFALEAVAQRGSPSGSVYRDKGVSSPRADLGWGPARAGVFHEKRIAADGAVAYDVAYTIDESLTRKVISDPNGPTIAFFGDSFTFGSGVSDSDTLPQSFADLTGRRLRVLNLAVGGYSPQQFLRTLEVGAHDALLRERPRLFVMLTAPFHASRTACKASFSWLAPSYALENGEAVYRGPCAARASGITSALRAVFGETELFRYFFAREQPVDQNDMDLYLAILIKAGKLAREKYAVPTLILYLPYDFSDRGYRLGPGYEKDDIIGKLREGGLTVLDASLDMKANRIQDLFRVGDGHPTGLANRIWAGQVRDYVASHLAAVLGDGSGSIR
jgi:hypothetical protein